MTISSAARGAMAPTLSLSAVTVTATATPGSPAGFSYSLSHAANVGLTYQQAGDPASKGAVPEVPVASGAQTLSWDPFAAGLPEGTDSDVHVHICRGRDSFSIVTKIRKPVASFPIG